jgi:pimeloyl-ACP methyl ester carboxylesterase
VRERIIEVEGVSTWVRESPGSGTPVVFWHGNPTNADDWLPFQKRLGRPSFAADLPAFGSSFASDEFDCSIHSYGRWAGALLDGLGIERYSLVIHDWGAVGLIPALSHPERVESMVAFNTIPFGASYEWHPLARVWRLPLAGEAANALALGPVVGLGLALDRPGFKPMPRSLVDRVRRNFGRVETRRAILALYRSADPGVLDEMGERVRDFTPRSLLLWAERDRYIGREYGRRWAGLLPNATLVEVSDAGHWSWLDRPALIDRAVGFLTERPIDSAP